MLLKELCRMYIKITILYRICNLLEVYNIAQQQWNRVFLTCKLETYYSYENTTMYRNGAIYVLKKRTFYTNLKIRYKIYICTIIIKIIEG